VQAAHKAFHEGDWAKMSPMARQDLMITFAEQIKLHADELAAIESNDNGKPIDAARFDIMFASTIINYYASQCHLAN
jgi:acyl-CoA reductase-like NAD-dependent aldehyde dehydrogenase